MFFVIVYHDRNWFGKRIILRSPLNMSSFPHWNITTFYVILLSRPAQGTWVTIHSYRQCRIILELRE